VLLLFANRMRAKGGDEVKGVGMSGMGIIFRCCDSFWRKVKSFDADTRSRRGGLCWRATRQGITSWRLIETITGKRRGPFV
jgi:hypothetical protein